jgi:Ser/Thr protein kinase RdoA (MazF antagonist)
LNILKYLKEKDFLTCYPLKKLNQEEYITEIKEEEETKYSILFNFLEGEMPTIFTNNMISQVSKELGKLHSLEFNNNDFFHFNPFTNVESDWPMSLYSINKYLNENDEYLNDNFSIYMDYLNVIFIQIIIKR